MYSAPTLLYPRHMLLLPTHSPDPGYCMFQARTILVLPLFGRSKLLKDGAPEFFLLVGPRNVKPLSGITGLQFVSLD